MNSVNIKLEIKRWSDDTDDEDGKLLQGTTLECFGGFERLNYTTMQHHGDPLTPDQMEGVNMVLAGFARLTKLQEAK